MPGFDYRDYYVFKQIMTKEIEENLVAKMETAVEEAAYKEKIKNTEFEYPLRGVFKSWTKRRYTSKEKFDLGLWNSSVFVPYGMIAFDCLWAHLDMKLHNPHKPLYRGFIFFLKQKEPL